MKIREVRDYYEEATDKASELVRSLSFAGIAVVWVLRTSEYSAGINYSNELLRPLVFFVTSLSCDLLQYLYKSIVWGSLNWHYWDKYHDNEKDVRPSRKWNWPTLMFFWAKAGFVVVAYACLLTFIYRQL
jgi:hypothetical protein